MRVSILDGAAEKPLSVTSNPTLSNMWDTAVGTGAAFEPQDVPFLEQFVFDMCIVEECRAHMLDEDGRPLPIIKGEDDFGNTVFTPNPYQKPMADAMKEAMKLAEELGLTRFARTRLGLAQAAGKAVTLSIAEQIDKAIARQK